MTNAQKDFARVSAFIAVAAIALAAIICAFVGCQAADVIGELGYDTTTPVTTDEVGDAVGDKLPELGSGVVVAATTGNYIPLIVAIVGVIGSFIAGRRAKKKPLEALKLITGVIYDTKAARVVNGVSKALSAEGNEKLRVYVTDMVDADGTNLRAT